ncbi:DUF3907 family protein [Bacillus lacus]|uniref:DUF3907 family protein n=1 Tax=Metabacillus lacus TaxID=1983721 RepID=A0A7X2IWI4_9BACI|nr:YpuI family protein [Metabacillus lacus]MRX71055.1 DUF3907 family protein [Metabacillus lacus]
MGNVIVKVQTEQVRDFLKGALSELEHFLNETTITSLLEETSGEREYFRDLLSNFRRLAVFCEEGREACDVVLNSDPFRKSAAEKVLYKIFHQCIEEFFNPRNDVWFEDSRSAYTGKNSIKFRGTVPQSIIELITNLEGKFQSIREELEYYETDYRTKMIHTK